MGSSSSVAPAPGASASDIEQNQPLKGSGPKSGKELGLEPVQWPVGKMQGAGQWETQGFETWTDEEKQQFREGKLREKWGVGQVSIRLPIQDSMQLIGLVYGYLPFIIPIWWAIWMIESWIIYGNPTFFPTYGLCIAAGFAIVNETITKQICKRTLSADITNRPPEAVCKHPGMPSGHVMNAYTLMTWCFLEALLEPHVFPEWLLIIVLVLGPVPWARVYNKDHTVPQVLVSGCIAVFMGSIAFLIRRIYFANHHSPWTRVVLEGYDNPDFGILKN